LQQNFIDFFTEWVKPEVKGMLFGTGGSQLVIHGTTEITIDIKKKMFLTENG
jgi:hypothetical protein